MDLRGKFTEKIKPKLLKDSPQAATCHPPWTVWGLHSTLLSISITSSYCSRSPLLQTEPSSPWPALLGAVSALLHHHLCAKASSPRIILLAIILRFRIALPYRHHLCPASSSLLPLFCPEAKHHRSPSPLLLLLPPSLRHHFQAASCLASVPYSTSLLAASPPVLHLQVCTLPLLSPAGHTSVSPFSYYPSTTESPIIIIIIIIIIILS